MIDCDWTKEQLIEELIILRKRVDELESKNSEQNSFREKQSNREGLILFAEDGMLLFTDEDLWESEDLNFNLFRNSPNPILVINPDFSIAYVNSALEILTGFLSDDLVSIKTPYPWFTDENLDSMGMLFDEIASGGAKKLDELYQRNNGEYFWVENTIAPVKTGGKLKCYLSIWIDITERKRAEEALANEKERLAVTLRSIGDGVIATDINGRIILINKAAEMFTGWKSDEAIDRKLYDVLHIFDKENLSRFTDAEELILNPGEIFSPPYDMVLLSRNGSKRIVLINGSPILDGEGKTIGVVIALRDITEKRKMEEEILKIQKLESVGILAGGIAHDFNNILTAILGNISLAKMYKEVDKIHQRLQEAEIASIKARDLTKQLLIFSKGGAPIKKTFEISEFIKESVIFALKGSNVRCEFDLSDNLLPVDLDEGMMNQVINNLIINVVDAMPEGGIIRIYGENLKAQHGKGERDYVRISIEDRIHTIPEDQIGRIFEPYFANGGRSKGLGLAASYSIVKQHDGNITVESNKAIGTIFNIYLPASSRSVIVSKQKEMSIDKPVMGKGKVLLMDDEKSIREIAGEILNSIGYKVSTSVDGKEAIELYKQSKYTGDPYDIVILDLIVPGGMGGKETIQKLTEIDPSIKAVVSSGYSNDPIMAEFKRYGFKGVVAKPYRVTELSHVLFEVMQNDH